MHVSDIECLEKRKPAGDTEGLLSRRWSTKTQSLREVNQMTNHVTALEGTQSSNDIRPAKDQKDPPGYSSLAIRQAMRVAQRGIPVVRIDCYSKHPRTRGWQEAATTDLKDIYEWDTPCNMSLSKRTRSAFRRTRKPPCSVSSTQRSIDSSPYRVNTL